MSLLLSVTVVSSKAGGDIAYDRETTIGRIQQSIEEVVSEHISRGQISTVKTRIKKPGGAIRRATRGMDGLRAITLEFRIALGMISDLDRAGVIRACQQLVPGFVTANIPADHMCSLVIALKNN